MNYIVYFDGPDAIGKTALRKSFCKVSDQKFFTVDRSPISNVVYDIKFGRRPGFDVYSFLDNVCSSKDNVHFFVNVWAAPADIERFYDARKAENSEEMKPYLAHLAETECDITRFTMAAKTCEMYCMLKKLNAKFINIQNKYSHENKIFTARQLYDKIQYNKYMPY